MSPTTAGTAAPWSQPSATVAVRTVVCYLRTANPGAVRQRHLQRQRARLQAASVAHDWTVVAWIEDLHQSGTTLDRSGLQHALALLADHRADALFATDATHLAVDAAATNQLAALAGQQGWQLLTVTPTPTSPAGAVATVVDPSRSRGPGRGGARRSCLSPALAACRGSGGSPRGRSASAPGVAAARPAARRAARPIPGLTAALNGNLTAAADLNGDLNGDLTGSASNAAARCPVLAKMLRSRVEPAPIRARVSPNLL